MRLEQGKSGQLEEEKGKCAKRVCSDEFQYGCLKISLYRREEALPFSAVLFKKLLPPEEGLEGDIKDLTDPFYRPQTESMLGQDTEDKEQAVSAVGNDGIREYSVRRRAFTLPADQAADTQADLYRPAIDEFDQGPAIVSVDAHFSPAPAEWTDL